MQALKFSYLRLVSYAYCGCVGVGMGFCLVIVVMDYVILMGPPGSGKGTQGARLCERYGYAHLSTGDLFREHMRRGTSLGKRIQQLVDGGRLVPDDVVHKLVVEALRRLKGVHGVLLDGYPRTVPQAEALAAYFEEIGARPVVLHLEVEVEELMTRIRLRGASSGRADDQDEEKVRRRLEIYVSETRPVLDYYKQCARLWSFAAVGGVEVIFESLCALLERVR